MARREEIRGEGIEVVRVTVKRTVASIDGVGKGMTMAPEGLEGDGIPALPGAILRLLRLFAATSAGAVQA